MIVKNRLLIFELFFLSKVTSTKLNLNFVKTKFLKRNTLFFNFLISKLLIIITVIYYSFKPSKYIYKCI